MRRIRKILLFSFFVLTLIISGCGGNETKIKVHGNRDNKVDVDKNEISFWLPNGEILSSRRSLVMADSLLLILDHKSFENVVSVYSASNYNYCGSFGIFGEGPGEIGRLGSSAYSQNGNKLLVKDLAKLVVYSFDIDSALTSGDYRPSLFSKDNSAEIMNRMFVVSDTSIIVQRIEVTSSSSGAFVLGRYNPNTQSFVQYTDPSRSAQYPFAVSPDDNLIVEAGSWWDELFLYDLDGNLKCEIRGPMYSSDHSRSQLHTFGSPMIAHGLIYVTWRGVRSGRGDLSYIDTIHVYSIEGDYIKTIKIPYRVRSMIYNPIRDTFIFSFNDFDEFGEIERSYIESL